MYINIIENIYLLEIITIYLRYIKSFFYSDLTLNTTSAIDEYFSFTV